MKGKIFNAQEVQAMLNGSKVMFREVIKIQPTSEAQVFATTVCSTDRSLIGQHRFANSEKASDTTEYFKCPYQAGQKIFCKESFAYIQDLEDCAREGEPCEIHYKADYDAERLDKQDIKAVGVEFLPASKMPEWASRLTLLIKEIRVERLEEVSEEDAIKEGVEGELVQPDGGSWPYYEGFRTFWNATHKKPEEKFEANPFVFVYTIEVVK